MDSTVAADATVLVSALYPARPGPADRRPPPPLRVSAALAGSSLSDDAARPCLREAASLVTTVELTLMTPLMTPVSDADNDDNSGVGDSLSFG